MIPLFNSTSEQGKERLNQILNRRFEIDQTLEEKVKDILKQVEARGDEALIEYTHQFDSPAITLNNLKVEKGEIEKAYEQVSEKFLKALHKAQKNIETFHKLQLPKSWFMDKEDGTILGQRVTPVDGAGLYVPGGQGGKTPLVSSVLMNGIPAKIAGVERIVLVTPPSADATISPHLLVAANEIGITEIYKVGSAWAIAALTYGTDSIKPVDVIVGPGNIFVTIAKKLVSGRVGIDMVAGPSEIVIIADETAQPSFVAADLLSQAEHDPMATTILLTTSERVAKDVASELEKQLKSLSRADIAQQSLLSNGLLMVVKDLDEAAHVANLLGPEHLELMVKDPWQLMPKIKHAGALFLGDYTPEPIGDYIAGPNHVLPTMGTARFSSALSVETFLKRTSIISYSQNAFYEDADDVMLLAETEGLSAHANSIAVRQNS